MNSHIKEKIASGVFIFSISALAVLISIAFYQGSLTGKVIENTEETAPSLTEYAPTCTDSDAGRIYSVKGAISSCDSSGQCSTKEDSCSDKTLTERFCQNSQENSEEHECEGNCEEGACVEAVKKSTYSGGGGGSSGAPASPATASTAQTYDIGELGSEQIGVKLVKGDNIKFTKSGVEYAVALDEQTDIQATISIGSQRKTLYSGEETQMDLDNDEVSDISIKLKSINLIEGNVNLILKSVS